MYQTSNRKEMKKRSFLMPSLAALLLVPVAPASASETPQVHTTPNAMQAKLATSQAMDTELEVKKLKELGQDPEKLQFKDGQSLEVKFDDGSSTPSKSGSAGFT